MIHEAQTNTRGNALGWFDYLVIMVLVYVTLFVTPL